MENLKSSLTTEILEYKCAHCNTNIWNLKIGKRSDGQTFLLVSCNNEECIIARKKELSMEDSDEYLVLWGEFNITGQTDCFEEPIDNIQN